MLKTIGILGGMGPAAGIDFQHKMLAATAARCDQDHVPTVVVSVPQTPDRTAGVFGNGTDPYPVMAENLRRLCRLDVAAVAIVCHTAHHWHARLQAEVPSVPLFHIADAAIDELEARGIAGGPAGVLAGDGTLASGVYETRLRARGYEPLLPDDQAAVMDGIRAVKRGDIERGRAAFAAAAHELLARGARRVILACTEIPVALNDETALLSSCVDATDALARQAVRFSGAALRQPQLPSHSSLN